MNITGIDTEYLSEGVTEALEAMPEGSMTALLEALESLTNDTELEALSSLVLTQETLADWDNSRANHWAERGQCEQLQCAGHTAHKYSGFQLSKGDRRTNIVVLDLSSMRVVLR